MNRTLIGRITAKRMGKLGGRPKKLDAKKAALVRKLYDDRNNKVDNICKKTKVTKKDRNSKV